MPTYAISSPISAPPSRWRIEDGRKVNAKVQRREDAENSYRENRRGSRKPERVKARKIQDEALNWRQRKERREGQQTNFLSVPIRTTNRRFLLEPRRILGRGWGALLQIEGREEFSRRGAEDAEKMQNRVHVALFPLLFSAASAPRREILRSLVTDAKTRRSIPSYPCHRCHPWLSLYCLCIAFGCGSAALCYTWLNFLSPHLCASALIGGSFSEFFLLHCDLPVFAVNSALNFVFFRVFARSSFRDQSSL